MARRVQTRNLEPEGLPDAEHVIFEDDTAVVTEGPSKAVAARADADRMLGREPMPVHRNHVQNEFRRSIVGGILARLLGSKAACDEIKHVYGVGSGKPFAHAASREAITFADALWEELDARERRP